MLEASFELFVPLVIKQIIDVGIENQDMAYVWKMAGLLLALAVIGLTCSLTAQYFAAKAAVGFSTKLKHVVYDHIQKLSFSEVDDLGTSTLITRMTSDMNQILVELVKLANLIITITKAVACGNRIQSVLEQESTQTFAEEPVKENGKPEVVVDFRDVSFAYHTEGEEALRHLELQVKRGETIGVIGGTGSGKTSLVHLIPRFYDATAGTVLVDGVDVKDYPKEQLRKKIGIVMQKAVLFKGTIRENLRWGNEEAADEELWQALRIAQAEEVVDKKDGKLDAMISQGGKNLSGGQRQRLTIARALVRKPEILILDDSTSALDYATDAKLRKALREMEEKTTVFIVSQRTVSIQQADRIIVLDDGNVIDIGTHEELLKRCEIYQEIYYSQNKKEEQGA